KLNSHKVINNINNEKLSVQEENQYSNPIEIKQKNCMDKYEYTADMRTCVYEATKEWEKEITKYLTLMKKEMKHEEYQKIAESQSLWEKQSKKDRQLVEDFILNHGGTIYFDFASLDDQTIIKNRAEFLQEIYEVYTNQI
ncbi:DUF1311 domain-containing protein, partial [bacterium]|nr:DUF1311 domain-containing protein [bacterium]